VRGRPGLIALTLKRSDTTCLKDVQASGLKSVSVFASRDGSNYKRFRKTTRKKILFHGRPGHRYRFLSVAVDKAGNKEDRSSSPDASLRLGKK
jgi:hypothetical protein